MIGKTAKHRTRSMPDATINYVYSFTSGKILDCSYVENIKNPINYIYTVSTLSAGPTLEKGPIGSCWPIETFNMHPSLFSSN